MLVNWWYYNKFRHRMGYYTVIQRIGKSIYITMKIYLRYTNWEKQVAEYSVKDDKSKQTKNLPVFMVCVCV